MILYSMQVYVDSREEWRHLWAVRAAPERETVLSDFEDYLTLKVGRSAKAKSRQYRLAKFHYGGCRHVVNPRA